MAASDFWSNRERAQADVEEVSRLRSLVNPFQELDRAKWFQIADRGHSTRRRSWYKICDDARERRVCLRTSSDRAWRASAGSHFTVRCEQAPPYFLRERRCRSGDPRFRAN